MTSRPNSTTSERQLCVALAATGRIVSLGELTTWRKDGLLPPLASVGLGTGRGKSYYWRQNDILARAEAVYDAMRRHGRRDQVLVTLFLSGFQVPLVSLRRAWLHRVKLRKPLKVRTAAAAGPALPGFAPGLSHLLLQALICAGDAVGADDDACTVLAVLERGLAKLGYGRRGNTPAAAQQLLCLATMIAASLEGGTLMRDVSDWEVRKAQGYLCAVMEFLKDCCEAEQPIEIIETLGPPLFILILTLLRSGQGAMLDAAFARVQDTGRNSAIPLVEPLYAQA